YVYLTDRDSDKVVSGGVNLYPAETERVLGGHPGVLDVAVIGVDHPEMGEELRALVVPRPGGRRPSERDLIDYTRVPLPPLKPPRSVVFVDPAGRSPMGKLNRRELRRRYGGTSTGAASTTPRPAPARPAGSAAGLAAAGPGPAGWEG